MEQSEFEALRRGDAVRVKFTEEYVEVAAVVANIDLSGGYINVDFVSTSLGPTRALVSKKEVVGRRLE